MTDQHPITPPPELVQQWNNLPISTEEIIAIAWRHGADQELEACCEWLHWQNLATHPELIPALCAARRPKPPSLKEQALETLQRLSEDKYPCNYQEDSDWDTIRRALESIDD